MRRCEKRRGYTLIEVMMSLSVLTAGALGLVAMQTATTRGNMEARQMATATMAAQRWVERLRRDALNWTQRSMVANAANLANTDYLQNVTPAGNAPAWVAPAPPAGSADSFAFDYYGRDTAVVGEMVFCTNIRLEWVFPGRIMRADVRVWWPRAGGGYDATLTDGANLVGCAAGRNPESLNDDRRVRMVYTSTVLRFNPAGP